MGMSQLKRETRGIGVYLTQRTVRKVEHIEKKKGIEEDQVQHTERRTPKRRVRKRDEDEKGSHGDDGGRR